MRYATAIDLFRQLSKRSRAAGHAYAYVPSHACNRSPTGWMGRGLCAAAVGACTQIQTTINTYALVDRRHGRKCSSVIKRSVSKWYQGWLESAPHNFQLISELKGFLGWRCFGTCTTDPVKDLSPNAKQRRLHFRYKSAALNNELKYLCWKKFSGGEWRSTQEISRVHRMIHWLNSMRTMPSSLLQKDFIAWRDLYRSYLSELGQYKTGTTSRMDGEQRPPRSPAATVRSSALCGRLTSCLDRPTIFALISRKTSGI